MNKLLLSLLLAFGLLFSFSFGVYAQEDSSTTPTPTDVRDRVQDRVQDRAQEVRDTVEQRTQDRAENRCEMWSQRLGGYLQRFNEGKVNKVDTYDTVVERLNEIADKYSSEQYSEEVRVAAGVVKDTGAVMAQMINGEHSSVTMSISDHYYNMVALVDAAQTSAANCDSGSGFTEDLQAVRTAWQNLLDDRADVLDYWHEDVRSALVDLHTAIRASGETGTAPVVQN